MTNGKTLAVTLSAYLINQTDFMQQKHSDLKRLLVRSRSFQGVSDGESADFFFLPPSKLEAERRATSVITFTFHTSIIAAHRVTKGGVNGTGI